MPRQPRAPKYRHHKARNSARVNIDGRDHYLGPYDSPESWEKYHRLLAEHAAGLRVEGLAPAGTARVAAPPLTVAGLALAYARHCDRHYRKPDGAPMAELGHVRLAIRFARKVHGSTRADEFGPLALKAVRQAMVDAGLARITVNQRVARVVRMFRWAAENEVLPASIYQALDSVEGLKKGRTAARESKVVRPVGEADVEAIRPFVSPQVWAIVELLRLTGARAGEITPMRTADVDRSGDVWVYRPRHHKTEGHGHERIIVLGPRAIEVLRPWLRADTAAPLFQPREAIEVLRQRRRERRATKLTPSQRARTRKAAPIKAPGLIYEVRAVYWSITKACRRAFPHPTLAGVEAADLTDANRAELKAWHKAHHWHPHQLRHALATSIRAAYGLEAAQKVLGHSRARTTEIYAERTLAAAAEVMREVG